MIPRGYPVSITKMASAHKNDHNSGGQLYKHICGHCNTLGKKFNHPGKDCRAKKSTESKKKRMRHCSSAVHKSKDLSKDIARSQSTSKFILQAEDRKYDNTFTARVITSNSSAAGESTNWRADYYKFKGRTFVQVVKSKSTRTHRRQKVSNQIPNIKNTKTGVTPVSAHVPVLTVSKSNNNAKTCKQYRSTGKPHTTKVNATNHQIVCYNSFATLYPGEDIVLCAPGDNEVLIPFPQKNAANSDHAPINQATKVSLTDAQVQHVAGLDQLPQRILSERNVSSVAAASEYTNTLSPGTHCQEITSLKGQNGTVKSVKNKPCS